MTPPPRLTLYAIPASHPVACVEAALRLKGIEYRRVDLIPHVHRVHQRIRFGQRTVPSLRAGDRRIVGSRAILRYLDELATSPRLYPSDPEQLRNVEDAERWADEELQAIVRQLAWIALKRAPASMTSYTAGSRMPVPQAAVRITAPLFAYLGARLNAASETTLAVDLENLERAVAHVDDLIASGVLGAGSPTAADLQIGSCLALAATFGDLAPLLAARPAGALTQHLFPSFPGHTPAGILRG